MGGGASRGPREGAARPARNAQAPANQRRCEGRGEGRTAWKRGVREEQVTSCRSCLCTPLRPEGWLARGRRLTRREAAAAASPDLSSGRPGRARCQRRERTWGRARTPRSSPRVTVGPRGGSQTVGLRGKKRGSRRSPRFMRKEAASRGREKSLAYLK
ncbi:hypothetical protein NDU88_008758 [Pleurodeles waltl]|uniref:Uncharacterized protein n=1 Tax=Pleurodeles waltl TaxID=8319 RepID=A0AAV7N7M0_PLEWA|nr:hypothetical protein NDU88_008758 [Pleurodeles waltl]